MGKQHGLTSTAEAASIIAPTRRHIACPSLKLWFLTLALRHQSAQHGTFRSTHAFRITPLSDYKKGLAQGGESGYLGVDFSDFGMHTLQHVFATQMCIEL
jgi:hypothetical protein